MKKIIFCTALAAAICMPTFAQKKAAEDPTVMTIAGKDIPLSEFLFIAQKDSGVDLTNKKSLENYVTLFKNFKLKVADAEAAGIDETRAFQEELTNYESQLRSSFLSDKPGETLAIHEIYNRSKQIPTVTHIFFPLPGQTVSKDTVSVYRKAKAAYDRIRGGEDFDKVGKELMASSSEKDTVMYERIEYLFPLQAVKAFEDAVFRMNAGEISEPVRTPLGFHIIRIDRKIPNPGKVRVAHILVGPDQQSGEAFDTIVFAQKAKEVYEKAKNGEKFEELVLAYSIDGRTHATGGAVPYFGLGEMVKPFEQAAFALKEVNDISEPVQTRYGYHIIKLLDKKPQAPYEEVEKAYYTAMRQGEHNFELFYSYDEREKKKLGYTLNQEAYDELQRLCDDYFPTDTAFYNRASKMDKVLMHMNNMDFPQNEFAEYLRRYPFSTKTYSGDFMNEVYRLFVRDIINELGRRSLNADHPEFQQLLKEYRDGILLFEKSNERVWSKPVEEQARLEEEWIKELNGKYDVKIDWKVLKNLKKYIQ